MLLDICIEPVRANCDMLKVKFREPSKILNAKRKVQVEKPKFLKPD